MGVAQGGEYLPMDEDAVDRNPMPGTESDPPRASQYNMATGEFTYLGETELPETYRPT